MQDKTQRIIAVIGASKGSTQEAKWAEEVGRELAKNGAAVVCGGLTGVMEAVCRGASKAGGVTIGILPGDSAEAANRYVRIPIVIRLGIRQKLYRRKIGTGSHRHRRELRDPFRNRLRPPAQHSRYRIEHMGDIAQRRS